MATQPEPSDFNPLTVPDAPESKLESGAADISIDDADTNKTQASEDVKLNQDEVTLDIDPEPEPEVKLDIGSEHETEDPVKAWEENLKDVPKDSHVSSPALEDNSKKPVILSEDTKDEKEDFKKEPDIVISETQFRTPADDRYSFAIPNNSPTVLKAELGGNWLTRHILFVVMLPIGKEVKRRFNDFLWLRTQLRKIYMGAFIPPLPERLPIALWPKGHLKTRKRELQLFLQRCSLAPFIAEEPTWQFFFQTTGLGTFEKARRKWDKGHSASNNSQICEHLRATFPITKEPLPDLTEEQIEGKFQEMNEFIQNVTLGLQRMFNASKKMADTFVLKVDSMMEVRENLLEYETTIGSRFSEEQSEVNSRLLKVIPTVPAKVSESLSSWCQAMHEVPGQHDALLVHSIKRHMMEFQVLEECFADRFKVLKDLNSARNKAAKWDKVKEVRSKDVSKKHADLERKEELETLSKLLYKIVVDQYDSIWKSSQHDFSVSTKRLINMHIKKYGQVAQIWRSTLQIFNNNYSGRVSL